MDTQDLANGSADTIGECTANLDSTVLARSVAEDEFDEESHEPCGTSYLFTPQYTLRRGSLTSPTVNSIPKLRLGAADACHSCEIVLDALTTYCSGILSLDSIEHVFVQSAEMSIGVSYRPTTGASQGESNASRPQKRSRRPRVEWIDIELCRLEGMLYLAVAIFSQWPG